MKIAAHRAGVAIRTTDGEFPVLTGASGIANIPVPAMDNDLTLLEQKLAILIAHTRALRAANEELRRELATTTASNHAMHVKFQQAGARLDALIARMPHD